MMSQLAASFASQAYQRQKFILTDDFGAKDFGVALLSFGQHGLGSSDKIICHLGHGPRHLAARISHSSHRLVSAEAAHLPRKDKLNPVQICHAILPCVARGYRIPTPAICIPEQDVA